MEAYTRMGLINKKPEKIYDKKSQFRQEWMNDNLSYMNSLVETKGDGILHPYVLNFKKHFPQSFQRIRFGLPAQYLDPTVAGRLLRDWWDRKEEIYLSLVRDKQLIKEREKIWRSLVGKAVRHRKYTSMYGKQLLPTVMASLRDRFGVTQSEEVQTDEVQVSSADTQSKLTSTAVPIMLCCKSWMPELKQLVEWLLLFSLDQQDDDEIEVVGEFIPEPSEDRPWMPYPKPVPGQIHPDAESMFHRNSQEALYPVKVEGKYMKLTSKEYFLRMPRSHKIARVKGNHGKEGTHSNL